MILAIGTTDRSGGLHTLTQQYIDSFKNRGKDVTWILLGSHQQKSATREAGNFHYIHLPDPWLYYEDQQHLSEEACREIHQIVVSKKYDLLFLPLQFTFRPYLSEIKLPTLKSCHLLFKELIQSTHNFYKEASHKNISADNVRLMHEIEYYKDVARLVINSKTSLAGLKKHYSHVLNSPYLVSPPGAHNDFFIDQPVQKIKKTLYFGRLNSQKNIHSLQKCPPPMEWSLSIVGDDFSSKFKFEQANICRLPWQNRKEIIHLLKTHMICLFPSHYEPWGLSLNESLAAGKICVAQKGAGGHEEQIEHGINGFLIDFDKTNFWEQLDEIFNLSIHHLSLISSRAQESARKWDDHFNELIQFIEKK